MKTRNELFSDWFDMLNRLDGGGATVWTLRGYDYEADELAGYADPHANYYQEDEETVDILEPFSEKQRSKSGTPISE